jgi:hypothetical protein
MRPQDNPTGSILLKTISQTEREEFDFLGKENVGGRASPTKEASA